MDQPLPPIDPRIKNLLENSYWGFVFSAFLLGASVIQGYIYFSRYNDRPALKLFVGCLLALDISTTFVWSFILHKILILNIRNPNPLAISNSLFTADSVMTLIITFFTQMFFARRVYLVKRSKKVLIPAVISVFAVLGTVAGCVRISTVRRNPGKWSRYKISTTLENLLFAMSDVIATFAMCILFVETAMESRRLFSVLRSLIIYTFNRGILVTSAQVLLVALYLYAPTKFYWSPFHICLSKLYVNTLLAMLNARRFLKAKVDGGNNAQVSSSGPGDDRDIVFGDGSSPQGDISMKTIDLSRSQAHATVEINTSAHSEHTETDGDGQV